MKKIIAFLVLYPTLWYNLLLSKIKKNRPWYTQIDENLYLGALPILNYPQKLHHIGVKAVINMCSEWNKAESRFKKLDIDHLHLPTSDFQPPSLDLIKQGVAFIDSHLKDKKTVYVHCKAGRGRSAMIVLCWLLSKGNITAKQAQEILLQKRPHVNPNLYKKDVVQQFQANLF